MGDVGLNAIATHCDEIPVIIYNRQLSGIVGGDGAEFVIAHELGHHFCGHLDHPSDDFVAVRAEELEADRFAGATLRKMNRKLEHILDITSIFPEEEGDTHPSRPLRETAIRAGWINPETALDCR
nr:ImmA/IrrE family metallo-endopeptidase [Gemmobacter fulvus]